LRPKASATACLWPIVAIDPLSWYWKVAGPLGATVHWNLLQVKTLLETGSPPTTPPGQLSGQTPDR
jgi:hypothetical protein